MGRRISFSPTGIPSIGKSELAKAYAGYYGREYSNVLYLHYQGSLRDTISGLEFSDDLFTAP